MAMAVFFPKDAPPEFFKKLLGNCFEATPRWGNWNAALGADLHPPLTTYR